MGGVNAVPNGYVVMVLTPGGASPAPTRKGATQAAPYEKWGQRNPRLYGKAGSAHAAYFVPDFGAVGFFQEDAPEDQGDSGDDHGVVQAGVDIAGRSTQG
jgi:hypothetical protein